MSFTLWRPGSSVSVFGPFLATADTCWHKMVAISPPCFVSLNTCVFLNIIFFLSLCNCLQALNCPLALQRLLNHRSPDFILHTGRKPKMTSTLFTLLRRRDWHSGDVTAAFCAEGGSRHVTLLQMVISCVAEPPASASEWKSSSQIRRR